MNPKKYMRLKKQLTTSDITYTFSDLKLKEISGCILPMDTFVLMNYALQSNFSHAQASEQQMYDLGKYQSTDILKNLIGEDSLPPSTANLQLALQPVALAGFGDLKITRFDMHNYRFIFSIRSKFAERYTSLFSIHKQNVDFFLAGMIAGSLDYFFGKKFKVKETACLVEGKPSCVFEAELA